MCSIVVDVFLSLVAGAVKKPCALRLLAYGYCLKTWEIGVCPKPVLPG